MISVAANLRAVLQKIREAESIYNRSPGTVRLLAVSKGHDSHSIRLAMDQGQMSFGENYCQEALTKIHQIDNDKLEWHFIGALQSNKAKAVAENFSWVQSIDRLKIAERLHQQRPDHLPPLNVCIQVNISHEASKIGVDPLELLDLAQAISPLSHLCLRGLMVIPQPCDSFQQQLHIYQKAYNLHNELLEKGMKLDTLSMGMTHDFMAAIAAGSTMVRIGSGIFGPRDSHPAT